MEGGVMEGELMLERYLRAAHGSRVQVYRLHHTALYYYTLLHNTTLLN